ncbi:putative transmembrane protein [Toxoplasma gondii MAS]|uniref:Putative transmembrane protein n=2 Tax=Toxoplasma gondii TaxID=5811 RepID=A0A086PPF5_TOXGO|nr:putative transmembrane protein [Toxoplasma gondii MAS]PUA83565.1 putative transmembrane protein [Toxoplasma gondii TgCATBr9]
MRPFWCCVKTCFVHKMGAPDPRAGSCRPALRATVFPEQCTGGATSVLSRSGLPSFPLRASSRPSTRSQILRSSAPFSTSSLCMLLLLLGISVLRDACICAATGGELTATQEVDSFFDEGKATLFPLSPIASSWFTTVDEEVSSDDIDGGFARAMHARTGLGRLETEPKKRVARGASVESNNGKKTAVGVEAAARLWETAKASNMLFAPSASELASPANTIEYSEGIESAGAEGTDESAARRGQDVPLITPAARGIGKQISPAVAGLTGVAVEAQADVQTPLVDLNATLHRSQRIHANVAEMNAGAETAATAELLHKGSQTEGADLNPHLARQLRKSLLQQRRQARKFKEMSVESTLRVRLSNRRSAMPTTRLFRALEWGSQFLVVFAALLLYIVYTKVMARRRSDALFAEQIEKFQERGRDLAKVDHE